MICVTVFSGHSLPVMLEWLALLWVSEVSVSNLGLETLCPGHGFPQSFKGNDRTVLKAMLGPGHSMFMSSINHSTFDAV